MTSPLFIQGNQQLIQLDGQVFKIPEGVDLAERYGTDPEVMVLTRSIAVKLGMPNFDAFKHGVDCVYCEHTLLTSEEAENERTFLRYDKCDYESDINQVMVFKDLQTGQEYIGTNHQCVIKDAFYRTLRTRGLLDKFLLEDVVPGEFLSRYVVEADSSMLEKAVEQYTQMGQ